MRQAVLIPAGGIVGFVLWTGCASWAYAYIGQVPLHCWFYYAVPLPNRFLWDGLDLILSALMAFVPFALAGRIYLASRGNRQDVYGKTEWADRGQMKQGGISSRKRAL